MDKKRGNDAERTSICFHSRQNIRIVDMIDQHLSVDIVLNTHGTHMTMDSKRERNDDPQLLLGSASLTSV